jgi:hypothetical protein
MNRNAMEALLGMSELGHKTHTTEFSHLPSQLHARFDAETTGLIDEVKKNSTPSNLPSFFLSVPLSLGRNGD